MVLDKIVASPYAPNMRNVLWIKPTKNGAVLYIFNKGNSRPLEIVDHKGTASISDDEVSPISDLNNTIQETVGNVIDESLGDSIQEAVEEAMENQEYAEDGDIENLFSH